MKLISTISCRHAICSSCGGPRFTYLVMMPEIAVQFRRPEIGRSVLRSNDHDSFAFGGWSRSVSSSSCSGCVRRTPLSVSCPRLDTSIERSFRSRSSQSGHTTGHPALYSIVRSMHRYAVALVGCKLKLYVELASCDRIGRVDSSLVTEVIVSEHLGPPLEGVW